MNITTKLIAKIRAVLFYPHRFGAFGAKSMIFNPLQLDGVRNMRIGRHTIVQAHTWLAAVPLTGKEHAELVIGDNCVIGHFNHIYATQGIVFENSVLTADYVYISDNLHDYSNPNVPIIEQPIRQINPVHIGEGSWLGEHACILGANIGKHCVIGANAVVTHDIPDYSIAVGVPARVIKRYNFTTQQWKKVNN